MAGDAWVMVGLVADREVAEIARPATRGVDEDACRSIVSMCAGMSVGLVRDRQFLNRQLY